MLEAEQTEALRTGAQQKDVERTEEQQTIISKAESEEDQTNTEATKNMVPTQELNSKLRSLAASQRHVRKQ